MTSELTVGQMIASAWFTAPENTEELAGQIDRAINEGRAWQPIDTAPKDRPILLREGGRDTLGAYYCGVWDRESQTWKSYCGQPVVWPREPDWWMSLPPPPSLTSEKIKEQRTKG